MASAFFGPKLDLHTGGQDLMFPHHENELAQSESFHGTTDWCNYFLHSGHVMLKDTKISKSLGNTISIDEVLTQCTPAQFRLLCLESKYNQSFNYSVDLLRKAAAVERRLNDFLRAATARLAADPAAARRRWGTADFELREAVGIARMARDTAFATDFDVPSAIAAMLRLVSAGHKRLGANGGAGGVAEAAVLVGETFGLLGVELEQWEPLTRAGWGAAAIEAEAKTVAAATDSAAPREAVDALVAFRHRVRQVSIAALKGKADAGEAELAQALLGECDSARDALGLAGVELRDLKNGPSWFVANMPASN